MITDTLLEGSNTELVVQQPSCAFTPFHKDQGELSVQALSQFPELGSMANARVQPHRPELGVQPLSSFTLFHSDQSDPNNTIPASYSRLDHGFLEPIDLLNKEFVQSCRLSPKVRTIGFVTPPPDNLFSNNPLSYNHKRQFYNKLDVALAPLLKRRNSDELSFNRANPTPSWADLIPRHLHVGTQKRELDRHARMFEHTYDVKRGLPGGVNPLSSVVLPVVSPVSNIVSSAASIVGHSVVIGAHVAGAALTGASAAMSAINVPFAAVAAAPGVLAAPLSGAIAHVAGPPIINDRPPNPNAAIRTRMRGSVYGVMPLVNNARLPHNATPAYKCMTDTAVRVYPVPPIPEGLAMLRRADHHWQPSLADYWDGNSWDMIRRTLRPLSTVISSHIVRADVNHTWTLCFFPATDTTHSGQHYPRKAAWCFTDLLRWCCSVGLKVPNGPENVDNIQYAAESRMRGLYTFGDALTNASQVQLCATAAYFHTRYLRAERAFELESFKPQINFVPIMSWSQKFCYILSRVFLLSISHLS
jgi:hypothetical protein